MADPHVGLRPHGALHLLVNMWRLSRFGPLAERMVGRAAFVLAYVACGLAASIASLWWTPLVAGAGASGALFGIVGLVIAMLAVGAVHAPQRVIRANLMSLIAMVGYNLAGATMLHVDNAAHSGGLLLGLVLGFVIGPSLRGEPRMRPRPLAAAVTLLLAAGYGGARLANAHAVPWGRRTDAYTAGAAPPRSGNSSR